MDPLTALGLAGNVITFIEFTSKLVSGAYKIYRSGDGENPDTTDTAAVVQDLQKITQRLASPPGAKLTEDDKALADLIKSCRLLSADLLKELEKLRANPHSKTDSLRASWQTMRKRGKLASMEKMIERYRRQILDRVAIMMREEQSSTRLLLETAMKQNENLATDTKDELRALLDTTVREIDQLRAAYKTGSLPTGDPVPTLKDIQEMITKMIDTAQSIQKEDYILRRLSYPNMHVREQSVVDAHAKTFRWLLRGSTSVDDSSSEDDDGTKDSEATDETSDRALYSESIVDSKREKTRRTFLNWLRHGNGVFYISGKPGSGKSTLMKYLCRQPRTRREIEAWAGQKKVVFADFFFWNSGIPLQSSLEGLYRRILWQVLRDCPSIMPDLFPSLWRDLEHMSDVRLETESFDMETINGAFELLTNSSVSLSNLQYCFFIDGLDEFEGDHWKICKSFQSWTSSGAVKICFSGRPYSEFEQLFPYEDLRFRLHELTAPDMVEFVKGELGEDERFTRTLDSDGQYSQLVDSIVERADGVFLWVRLATRSILSGLGNRYSVAQLKSGLETVPDGLAAMFRSMLDSIALPDRRRAAQTFSLLNDRYISPHLESANISLMRLRPHHYALVHSVLDDILDDPLYDSWLYDGKPQYSLNDAEGVSRVQTMKDRLTARCKGLVEVVKPFTTGEPYHNLYSSEVQFIHRSVRDYFSSSSIQQEFQNWAGGGFNEFQHLAMALVALQRLVDMRQIPVATNERDTVPRSPSKTEATQLSDDLHFQYNQIMTLNILACLRTVACAATWNDATSLAKELDAFDNTWERQHQERGHLGSSNRCGPYYEENFVYSPGLILLSSRIEILQVPFVFVAAFWGLTDFVLRKVEASPELLHREKHHSLLLSATLGALSRYKRRYKAVLEEDITSLLQLPRLLLLRGASPNAKLDISLYPDDIRVGLIGKGTVEENLTVWNVFLLASAGSICRSTASELVSELMELYLDHGAEPNTCFIGYKFETRPTSRSTQMSAGAAQEREPRAAKFHGPYYMDLDKLIQVWAPANSDRLSSRLRRQGEFGSWGPRRWNNWFFASSRAMIRRLSVLDLDDDSFVVTSVVGHQYLSAAPVFQLNAEEEDKIWHVAINNFGGVYLKICL